MIIFAHFRLPSEQCLEAVRDTLDDLAYYLLRRTRASSSAATSTPTSALANNQLAGGCKSPLASGMGTSTSGPRTPSRSGSMDGGRIGSSMSGGSGGGVGFADSSSHAIDSAARELALRCAHNIARSSRALSARFVHVSAARVDRAFALFAATARSGACVVR